MNKQEMNVVLSESYICRKLRMKDGAFKDMYERLFSEGNVEQYRLAVLDTPLTLLNPELVAHFKDVIGRRYQLDPTRRLLFPHPTIRQWLFDLAGEYQPDDIMDYLSQASGAKVSELRTSGIESTLLDRPFVIDLVDHLEEVTGKVLHNPKEKYYPLRYLGNVKFTDLADYFSPKGSERINVIRRHCGLV